MTEAVSSSSSSSEMAHTKWPSRQLSTAEVNIFLLNHLEFLDCYLRETASSDFKQMVLSKLKTKPVKRQSLDKVEPKKKTFPVNLFEKIRKKCSAPDRTVPKQIKGPSYLFTQSGLKENSRRIAACKNNEEINAEIYKLGEIVARGIRASTFRLFIVDNKEMSIFDPDWPRKYLGAVATVLTVASYAVETRRSVNISDISKDTRFPNGLGCKSESISTNAHHVLCTPIKLDFGVTYGVLEYTKRKEAGKFTSDQALLATSVLKWVAESIQNAQTFQIRQKQLTLNEQLLQHTTKLFDDVSDPERVINNILTITKSLVMAERCSLFVLDRNTGEMYADRFDEGKKDREGNTLLRTGSINIRIPGNTGIAGYVAKTGEVVNVKNVYGDNRFNPEIDSLTGYKTRHVLCIPISSDETGILAVMQMLNRRDGRPFSAEDEQTFVTFSEFCALALHYANLQTQLADKHTKYKTAMARFKNQMTCGNDEMARLLADPHIANDQTPTRLYSFDFFCYNYTDILPQLFIRMVEEMFPSQFDVQKLCRFILTVKRNYRPIPYHNFYHGFHVAHSVWRMLSVCQACVKNFNLLEKLGLVIGAVCHDLDHRALTNDYLHRVDHPLAALYSTSTLEHHHYHLAVTILHSEGNDIFEFMTPEEYKVVLDHIKNNILSTDLCRYFCNKAYLDEVIREGTFNIEDQENRKGLISILMTGADLCTAAKTWDRFTDLGREYDGGDIMKSTISKIYEEFYFQGDQEKAKGLEPQPMMDRVNSREIPQQQIGFIDFIAQPLYTTLSILLPETADLLKGVQKSRMMWSAQRAFSVPKIFDKIKDVADKL